MTFAFQFYVSLFGSLCLGLRRGPTWSATATRSGLFINIRRRIGRDAKGRREDCDINRCRLISTFLTIRFAPTILPAWAELTLFAIGSPLTLRRCSLFRNVRRIGATIAICGVKALAFIAFFTLPLVTARLTVFLHARATLRDDAEIVVSELEIIFSQNAIALKLRFAGKVLILFEELRCIATCTVVDAAAIILPAAIVTLRPTTASATTALLTII